MVQPRTNLFFKSYKSTNTTFSDWQHSDPIFFCKKKKGCPGFRSVPAFEGVFSALDMVPNLEILYMMFLRVQQYCSCTFFFWVTVMKYRFILIILYNMYHKRPLEA